jgi:alpha-tubulin suppressor-like RCC1 family protein
MAAQPSSHRQLSEASEAAWSSLDLFERERRQIEQRMDEIESQLGRATEHGRQTQRSIADALRQLESRLTTLQEGGRSGGGIDSITTHGLVSGRDAIRARRGAMTRIVVGLLLRVSAARAALQAGRPIAYVRARLGAQLATQHAIPPMELRRTDTMMGADSAAAASSVNVRTVDADALLQAQLHAASAAAAAAAAAAALAAAADFPPDDRHRGPDGYLENDLSRSMASPRLRRVDTDVLLPEELDAAAAAAAAPAPLPPFRRFDSDAFLDRELAALTRSAAGAGGSAAERSSSDAGGGAGRLPALLHRSSSGEAAAPLPLHRTVSSEGRIFTRLLSQDGAALLAEELRDLAERTADPAPAPVLPPAAARGVAVAAGAARASKAPRLEGARPATRLYCWGRNAERQLLAPSQRDYCDVPTACAALCDGAVRVACGIGATTAALAHDGRLIVGGAVGGVERGAYEGCDDVRVALAAQRFRSAATAKGRIYAINDVGRVVDATLGSWLGGALDGAAPALPKLLHVPRGVAVTVACSAQHAIVLTSERRVFGVGATALLGLGNSADLALDFDGDIIATMASRPTIDVLQPLTALALVPVATIACGAGHSVAISTGGAAYAWGDDAHGQCGGASAAAPWWCDRPRLVVVRSAAARIGGRSDRPAPGGGATGAADEIATGTVVVVSSLVSSPEYNGRLAIITRLQNRTPSQRGRVGICLVDADGTRLQRVGADGVTRDHILAVKRDSVHRHVEKGVHTPRWTRAACGEAHTVLVARDGGAWACGRGAAGQLGLRGSRATGKRGPLRIDVERVVDVACGSAHTLLLTQRGSLYACGQNAEGQLGDGAAPRSTSKVVAVRERWLRHAADASPAPRVVAIAAGGAVSAALVADDDASARRVAESRREAECACASRGVVRRAAAALAALEIVELRGGERAPLAALRLALEDCAAALETPRLLAAVGSVGDAEEGGAPLCALVDTCVCSPLAALAARAPPLLLVPLRAAFNRAIATAERALGAEDSGGKHCRGSLDVARSLFVLLLVASPWVNLVTFLALARCVLRLGGAARLALARSIAALPADRLFASIVDPIQHGLEVCVKNALAEQLPILVRVLAFVHDSWCAAREAEREGRSLAERLRAGGAANGAEAAKVEDRWVCAAFDLLNEQYLVDECVTSQRDALRRARCARATARHSGTAARCALLMLTPVLLLSTSLRSPLSRRVRPGTLRCGAV